MQSLRKPSVQLKIVEIYSHLNGLEFLLVHRPELWEEVKNVIDAIDAES